MAKGIKTGGRQQGTPNRLTFQTRQLLANVLADEIESLPELLQKLEPQQRVDAICKLGKFVLPQMVTMAASIAERKGIESQEETLKTIEQQNNDAKMFRV